MLQFALIEDGRITWGEASLVDRWRSSQDSWLWIDSDGADPSGEAELARRLISCPAYLLRDFQHRRRPPKYDSSDHCDLLLLKGLDADTSDLEFGTIQLGMLIHPRVLITRHSGESRSINHVRDGLHAGDPTPEDPYALSLRISQILFDRYLPIVLALEERLEVVEDELFHHPEGDYLEELTGYRTSLKKLRRYTAYHQATMASLLRHRERNLTESEQRMLRDINEALERLGSLQGLFYDLCGDLIDGYLSLSAHRLNEIMKVLTIITAIFVPLSFVAGVYGMNFQFMPELGTRWGYFVVLGVMSAIGIGLIVLFRRRRWL